MNKNIKIILAVSLVLNVLLLGMAGGHAYTRWSAHPWHEMKQQLSPESRNLIGRTFQNAFREIKPLGDKARKARAKLVKILSADEFDEAAYDTVAAELLEIGGEMKTHKVDTIKTLASQMSVEDRRKMADKMAYMVGGGHERPVKRHRKPEMITPDHKPEAKD